MGRWRLTVLAAVLASGCGGSNVHAVRSETWFVPVQAVEGCDAARRLLAREQRWRLSDYRTFHGKQPVNLRPTDELWVVELEPKEDFPFDDLTGFEASVTCGSHTHEAELLECTIDERRTLLIPANQLPEAGTPSQTCRFELRMRHGEHEWFAWEHAVVLRRGLGQWRGHSPSSTYSGTSSVPSFK